MSIQSNVNQMLGTGAAVATAQRAIKEKQLKTQQRQLALDEKKRKQALKEQQQQLAAKKKQEADRTSMINNIKNRVKQNYGEFGGLSNDAKMSLIQQVPELKNDLQKLQELGGNK